MPNTVILPALVCLAGVSQAPVAGTTDAPTLSHAPEHPSVTQGRPLEVAYEVRWTGPADAYAVFPFEPDPFAWGSARLVEARSESRDAEHVVRYTVEYVAEAPGHFETPSFRVAYGPPEAFGSPEGDGTESGPVEPGVLRAPPIPVEVSARLSWVYPGVGTAAVALLVSIAVFVRARRAKARPGAIGDRSRPGTVQEVVNLAKEHRLDGKLYEYYRELARGASLLGARADARALRERLEKDAERIGYGALEPSEDELEGALRDLQRIARDASETQTG